MWIGEHGEPFFVDRFFENLVLGPNNHLDNVVDGAVCSVHNTANIPEHEPALALDIGRYFPRFGIYPEYSAGHHERTDGGSHGDGVVVLESGNLETAASAHNVFSPFRGESITQPKPRSGGEKMAQRA